MKHGWLRRALILLIALGLCAGMFLYSREMPMEKSEPLRLWYVQGDCDGAAMESMIARCRKDTGLKIEVTSFTDESFLGTAFEGLEGRTFDSPDLLFCSHIRAARLDENGNLTEIAQPLPISESLAGLRPAVGRSFFPMGSRLPVLLVNTALTDGSFDSLEALFSEAGESPFVGCDCWADFLYMLCAAEGIKLTGDSEQDLADAHVAAVYNLLAQAVFRGGLTVQEPAVEYVRQGLLPCAVTMSTTLAGMTDKTLDVQLIPLQEGAQTHYAAELMGFALLEGADTAAAEIFFQWLWSGQGAVAAMDAGIAPIIRASDSGAGSTIGRHLSALTENVPLFLPDGDEPFDENRDGLERWLREALGLLT